MIQLIGPEGNRDLWEASIFVHMIQNRVARQESNVFSALGLIAFNLRSMIQQTKNFLSTYNDRFRRRFFFAFNWMNNFFHKRCLTHKKFVLFKSMANLIYIFSRRGSSCSDFTKASSENHEGSTRPELIADKEPRCQTIHVVPRPVYHECTFTGSGGVSRLPTQEESTGNHVPGKGVAGLHPLSWGYKEALLFSQTSLWKFEGMVIYNRSACFGIFTTCVAAVGRSGEKGSNGTRPRQKSHAHS